jgi:hypothetical protein
MLPRRRSVSRPLQLYFGMYLQVECATCKALAMWLRLRRLTWQDFFAIFCFLFFGSTTTRSLLLHPWLFPVASLVRTLYTLDI